MIGKWMAVVEIGDRLVMLQMPDTVDSSQKLASAVQKRVVNGELKLDDGEVVALPADAMVYALSVRSCGNLHTETVKETRLELSAQAE